MDVENQKRIRKMVRVRLTVCLQSDFRNCLSKHLTVPEKKCVVLIDEYDKPLLDIFENEQLVEYNRSVFKGFFSTLKSFDAYLR